MKALLIASYLLAMSTAACSGPADIPPTPNLRTLLENYERPTASLDGSNVAAALASMPNLRELAAAFEGPRHIARDVDSEGTAPTSRSTRAVRIQGSVGLKIRCPGERTDPNYDEMVNGSVTLTLAVADNQILRSMGGEAKACVLEGSLHGLPARIQLDGDLAFDLGGNLGSGERWTGTLLASLPGELRIGDYVFRSISGRYSQGRFQHLVTLNGGTIVFELSAEDGITIRDGSGTWFCGEGEPCARR